MIEHYVTALDASDSRHVLLGCRCGELLIAQLALLGTAWSRHIRES